MRYLVNREEMQAIDAYCINEIGIPSVVLMERAAMAIAEVILDYVKDHNQSEVQVLVVTESGNNGGDGLAAARLLYEKGCHVTVYQIGGIKHVSEQYEQQKHILEQLGIPVAEVTEETIKSWSNTRYDVVLDAVFGVGLHRELAGPHREIIECLNSLGGLKCAADIPTGLDSTSGKVLGAAFRADVTVTFGCEKLGHYIGAGPEYCGKLLLADIGFPRKALTASAPKGYCYEPEELTRIPVRRQNGNKGTFGKVAIIAGSEEVCGAAVLSAKGAYRTGCGLVEVLTHINNRETMQQLLPEALLRVYSDREEAIAGLKNAMEWADVMVIGPGIGTDEIGNALTKEAMAVACPLVVDADAITVLSKQKEWWKLRNREDMQMIVTPHMKEMERISGIPIRQLKECPWEGAAQLSRTGVICVLKDARTVVTEPDTDAFYINLSGNDGMATGGSGDVLSGVIAALAAQGLALGDAARLGVYLHGLAGDRAAEHMGKYSMLAGDIVEGIGEILEEIPDRKPDPAKKG